MGLFKKKAPMEGVPVTVKVIVMASGRHVSVMEEVQVAEGSTVIEALKSMRDGNKIDKEVFGMIKNVKPPLQMVINGARVEGKKLAKIELNGGDEVSILMPFSGG